MSNQKEFFTGPGRNQWHDRNQSYFPDANREELKSFSKFLKPGQKVLEIGCAAGYHAPFFEKALTTYYGIDVADKSIAAARTQHPQSHFQVASSDELPFSNHYFDFLFFGFCLYVVDRNQLEKTISEADRVLKPGGYLAIYDFDPDKPITKKHRDDPGIYVYKMDYSRLFLAQAHYSLIDKKVYKVDPRDPDDAINDPDRRAAVTILKKAD